MCGDRQWKDGLLPTLLRKLCVDDGDASDQTASMKVLLMDGQVTLELALGFKETKISIIYWIKIL